MPEELGLTNYSPKNVHKSKDLVRYIPSELGRKEGRNVTRHNFIYTNGLAVYYGFRV